MKTYRFVGLALTAGAMIVSLAYGCSDDTSAEDDGDPGPSSSVGPGGAGGAGGGGGGLSGFNGSCDPPSGTLGTLKITEVAGGLTAPVEAVSPSGDDERIFIIEQDGIVQLLKAGATSPFLDISGKVLNNGEQGLLGIAFHPDYADNGRFFVHYTNAGDGRHIIEEYARSADNPDVAGPNPVGAPYISYDDPAANHNGGSLHFNPIDKFLYIGFGDGGGGYDTYMNGQNLSSALGKLLRIDVASNPHTIPAGNLPGAGFPEIYDYGLRNPYRWTFDTCTGDRYIGDVGQDCFEEIDVAGYDSGNKNWGWVTLEGLHCTSQGCDQNPPGDCNDTGLEPPVVEYAHYMQGHSVIGGYVYRGNAIPALRGTYFYAEFYDGSVFTFRWENGTASTPVEVTDDLQSSGMTIAGFGQDNLGEMYIVDYGAGSPGQGKLHRIEPE
jgi:glucose/arabinose dehydrogenase